MALATLALVVVAGCGRDDFANDPRPAVPAQITVKVSNSQVLVSPGSFGAGLVNFTIANLSDETASLVVEDSAGILAQSDVMPPGGNALLKAEMEPGLYEAGVEGPAGVIPFEINVGSDRPSGQNDLLLP